MLGVALLVGAQAAATDKPTPVVTILQGSATVIRALSQFDAAEGMPLLADDLVRTNKDTFLRIEYADQTSIELGPGTQLQVNHPSRRRGARPALYLLEGWLKVAPGQVGAGVKPAFASVGLDVVDLAGVMVMRTTNVARELFAEQGTARCIAKSARGAEPIMLRQGDFVIAAPDKAPKRESRPPAEFTDALPRPYRDTLPFRYDLFKDRPVTPQGQLPFSYADVEPWLNGEPSIRRQFVSLWRRKANDTAFRASLDRDLQKHPEWDRVLHPEKYEEEYQPPQPPRPVPAAVNPTQTSQPAPVSPPH
jgi:hypothetical protein